MPVVATALLIDGGQSGCRAALLEDGEIAARATGPGLARVGRDYTALRGLLDGPYDVVAAGLTGFDGNPDVLRGVFDAPLIVTNDAVIAYLGALGDEPGTVIVAGTGVIALAAGEGGITRADGLGPLLGDIGGGYWIGQQALREALTEGHFAEAAHAHYGDDLIAAVYDAPDPVAAIASFTPQIAALANAGDTEARSLLAAAGRHLASTVRAAQPKGVRPSLCSWAGGVFAVGELILGPFRAELGGVEVRAPLGDALEGARRLLERPRLFESLIEEVG